MAATTRAQAAKMLREEARIEQKEKQCRARTKPVEEPVWNGSVAVDTQGNYASNRIMIFSNDLSGDSFDFSVYDFESTKIKH